MLKRCLFLLSTILSSDVLAFEKGDVVSTLSTLGTLSYRIGKVEKAANYLQQALTRTEKIYGEEHADLKILRGNLGYVMQQIWQ